VAVGSKIEWTEATWNPVAGCTVLSPGCTNCYAMRMASRLAAMGQPKYDGITRVSGGRPKWTGRIKLDYKSLKIPFNWKKGRLIFVNSMSDLFHEKVPLEYIKEVFNVMENTPQHTYQILTKRAELLENFGNKITWPENVWMGVSVESEDYWWRVQHLRNTPAKIRFLSLEPLLGAIETLQFEGIDWVIAGGESGPGCRPVDPDWIRAIRDACVKQQVAFHFKQWGGSNKKATGRVLDHRTWDEMPPSQCSDEYVVHP
jgi:protein gp37